MSAEQLDELFGQLAEACRAWLLAWTSARPSPSRAPDPAHGRLIDAHHELERLLGEIEEVFQA